MPDLPSPGEKLGSCNKAVPLLPFYALKVVVLLLLGLHPHQWGSR